MKKIKILICIVIVYILAQFVVIKKESNLGQNFKAKNGFPLIIAHGGSKQLFPENTVYAFERTMELPIDVLELDLRMTKDDILITHHNETIDETSDGSGKVRDYTYDQLKQFNFGAKFIAVDNTQPYLEKDPKLVPSTLEDLFLKYGQKVLFIAEIKDEGDLGKKAVDILNTLIKKYQLEDKVNVASFLHENNEYFTTLNSKTSISAGESKVKEMVLSMYVGFDFLKHYNVHGVQIPTHEIVALDTSYLISKMKKHNLFVHFWTINDEKTMRKLIDKKVDGIITDRPDILIELKNKIGG